MPGIHRAIREPVTAYGAPDRSAGLFRRVFKNSAMLTAGKVYTALTGLVYLGLATRALGAYDFGVLILIHAYAVAVRDCITLKTSQCVVRYGTLCLENNRRADLQKLVKLTSLLDLAFCIIGTLVGALAVGLMGGWFGITEELTLAAQIYCGMILFSFKATPLGLLHLFNRFDLVALTLMVTPSIRLVGACVAFFIYQDVVAFLSAWFAAGACHSLATIYFGWREFQRRGLAEGMDLSMRELTVPHQGIWSFTWTSHVHRTLHTSIAHVSTLMVGFLVGPVGAGLFRVAQEAAAALLRPAQLFNETIYPEMAKIAVGGDYRRMRQIIAKSALLAGGVAGIILLLTLAWGRFLLDLFFGSGFGDAYGILILLMAAAAVTMGSFALDPALYSIGRPDICMYIRLCTTALHLALIVILVTELGLSGAGIASIVGSLATALLLLFFANRLLRA